MSEELKITKEKVLEAAKACPTAKETLKTLFPEVFVNDEFFNIPMGCVNIISDRGIIKDYGIQVRSVGKFAGKAFYLSPNAKWSIEFDKDWSAYILIPRKR